MIMEQKSVHGRGVIEALADIYEQLYIAPGEDGEKKYADIVQLGESAPERDLSHFRTHEEDSLIYEETPAGFVMCITLYEREDFVTFVRIMANRCKMVDIPDTQGASTIDGVINWKKIYAHRDEFLKAEEAKGNPEPDWNAEFNRFTADRNNFRDALIVLSVGPYSAVPGKKLGIEDDRWIQLSHEIRKYHECTHFICRKKYPDKKDAIWDELVADAVGIYAAFNKYDPAIQAMFLGIRDGKYEGGRLENYIEADTEEEKNRMLSDLSGKISQILESFNGMILKQSGIRPFELAVLLEETMDTLWT